MHLLRSIGKSAISKALASLGYEIRQRDIKPNSAQRTLPAPGMTYKSVARLFYFQRIFEMIKHIDGNVIECGVGTGRSLMMFSFLIKEEGKGRTIYGFDSFEGFPEPAPQDKPSATTRKGKWGGVEMDAVVGRLLVSGLSREFIQSQVILVKGFFSESLPKYKGGPIALLHVDADLYDSIKTCLKELYPRVAIGGAVLFDEYMSPSDQSKFPGAQMAIDEFFGARKCLIKQDSVTGKYFLLKT